MLSHRLLLDEVDEDYQLLAIHTSLEEYKLAFYLNKQLHLGLKRARVDLDYNHGKVQAIYPHYYFKEPEKYRSYHLIKNKYKGPAQKVVSSGSLFQEEEVSPERTYFIPEYREVDFFLKLDEEIDSKRIQAIISNIASIPNIFTIYQVDPNQLKSKNNLILD